MLAITGPAPAVPWERGVGSSQNYGAFVATSELVTALLRYGREPEYQVFCEDGWSEAWQTYHRSLRQLHSGVARLRVRATEQLDFAVRYGEVDAVLATTTNMPALTALRRALLWPRIPVVGVTHSISYAEAALFFTHLLIEWPEEQDTVVVASAAAEAVARHALAVARDRLGARGLATPPYPGRLARIPFGVDLERFHPRDRAACRSLLGLPADRLMLLSLGRWSIHDKMDPLPLLTAFRALRREHDACLVLAGEDRAHALAPRIRAAVQQLGIQDDVWLLPSPAQSAVPALYGAADIFVSMVDNVQETFGLTPLEALASGLPCVVSDWDGYRDVVTHGLTGYLVPTCADLARSRPMCSAVLDSWPSTHLGLAQCTAFDVDAFVGFVGRLADDAALREEIGRNARTEAEARFSWPEVASAYEALWGGSRHADVAPARSDGDPRDAPLSHVDYARAFGHYPTTVISDDTRVALTVEGSEVLSGAPPLAHQEVAPSLRDDLLRSVLERTVEPTPVSALGECALGASAADVTRHVAWLLKAGLLRLETRDAAR